MTPPSESIDDAADQANLDYADRQTELALEYLRDQMAKEKPKLLDQLGWTQGRRQKFLDRWQQMKQAAAEKGSTGEDAKKQYKDALQSLGLRPRGTELHRGGITRDKSQGLRDAGKFPPPADWAEQLRAYTRGVSSEEREKNKK